MKGHEERLLIGWNEWCALPDLGIPAIKSKIDTGATTSAIHAYDIKPFKKQKKEYVRFFVHPLQRNKTIECSCEALVIDHRSVMSSNGHRESRYVIMTELHLGGLNWPIQITLSNRDPLTFRMLLGREALHNRVIIDPSHVLLQGSIRKSELSQLYLS